MSEPDHDPARRPLSAPPPPDLFPGRGGRALRGAGAGALFGGLYGASALVLVSPLLVTALSVALPLAGPSARAYWLAAAVLGGPVVPASAAAAVLALVGAAGGPPR